MTNDKKPAGGLSVSNALLEHSGYDALWLWFGLGYSSWLTLPRVEMHEMPDEWQATMARLLKELDEEFPNKPDLATYVSVKHGGRFVKMPRWVCNYRHPDKDAIAKLRSQETNHAFARSLSNAGLGSKITLWNIRAGVILVWPLIFILDALIVFFEYETWANARAESNYALKLIWDRK